MVDHQQIRVEDDARTLAEATVPLDTESGEASAQVHVASGHLPVGTRQQLVDSVHEAVSEDRIGRLTAAVPLGDAELVDGIRDHLDDAELRAAGATSIITGDIKPG